MLKKTCFSTFFIFILISIHAQGWIRSNSTTAVNIEPSYSEIFENNIYVLSNFADTIYQPVIDTAYGFRDILLQKYDLNGNFIWSRHIGNDSVDLARGIDIDADGNIYISGSFGRICKFQNNGSLTSTGSNDAFLAKYNPDGTLIWKKLICRGSGPQNTVDLIIDDNRIVLLGYYRNTMVIGDPETSADTLAGFSYYIPFLAKFTLNGDFIWAKSYTTSAESYFRRIAITENGYYLGGPFQGTINLDVGSFTSSNASQDILIYKTDSSGTGQWARRFYGTGAENFRSLETDEYDNIYLLGTFQSAVLNYDSTQTIPKTIINSGGYDSFVAKYNRTGNLQWLLKRASLSSDYFNDIAIKNNLIYATGYFTGQIVFGDITLNSSGPTNQDVFFVALNNLGDPIHAVSIVGTGVYEDRGINILMDNQSQAYVIGYYKSPSIQIGASSYNNSHPGKSDQFLAVYQHPFKAVFTDEDMISCNGANDGMLTATGYFGRPPYTYSWSHNATLNNPVATGLAPGTYTVTIRDQDNQFASVTRDVTQPATLSIAGVVTPVTCYNGATGSINITVTGGSVESTYSYRWSTLDGSGIVPVNEDQTNISSGTYSVEVIDDNLCEAANNFIVTEPAAFDYTGSIATAITTPPGGNGAVTINITGGNTPYKTYRWDGPSGYSASTEDITLLNTPGLYYFTLTDAKDCVSDTSFAVLDNITFIAQITAKTDVTCKDEDDGTATVTVYNATGQVSYAWSGFAPTNNNTIINMPPGKYTMIASDQGGHTAIDTITIFEPDELFLFPLDKIDPLCNGDNKGVVNLTLSGGTLPYSYNWNNGLYSGEDLVNIPGGTYTVLVTDANNCNGNKSVVVVEPQAIGLFITIEDEILCNGENTAVALAHGSGGTPAGTFTYLWDDPGAQITPYAYELEAGNYTVTITDNNGCSLSSSVNIDEPNALSLTTQINNPLCAGDVNGSIIPTPSGGTGTGYEYIWSNNVFQRFNTDLAPGQYILRLNDANNCVLIDTFNLVDPEPVTIASVTPSNPSCTGLNDGSIAIVAAGGTGTYEYSLNGGTSYDGSATVGSLPLGDYEIRVRDANDCISETTPVSLTLSDACGLIIYDAFSPNNGDDMNNEWIIENVVNFPEIKVRIFNIWGGEVFSSTGYEEPWDGTYNGKELPSGTYYYVIEPGDGSKTLSGPVNIVK